VTAAKRTASKRSRSPSLDDAIAFRIHRTNRFLRTTLTRMLQEHGEGITPEQFFVLWRLREEAPRRQVDLTEPVLGDPPNVARLVDALSHRGFVERRADPDDRRSWQVHLTPAGTALMKRLEPVVVGERTSLSAGLDDAQLDQLVAALDVIDANLRARLVR
jgi:DNA-binding MarR family transcriptional regulator